MDRPKHLHVFGKKYRLKRLKTLHRRGLAGECNFFKQTISIDSALENDEYFIIAPGQFILASTVETISIPKSIAATLEGLSSVARLGITVHAAGLVNAGTGIKSPTTLTLEISCQNSSPVKLYPGMRIVQIIFHRLESEAKTGYDERKSSKYVGQKKQILVRNIKKLLKFLECVLEIFSCIHGITF